MFWHPTLVLAVGVLLLPWPGPMRHTAEASESPERECCDPIYPLLTPTATTIINPTSLAPTSPGFPGPNVKNTVAILNCLLAKQLCQDDASCSAIQHIIPKVCGIEQVACSTTTVVKCQAALRTLQGFQFFRPTCLCREPSLDPECNQFRDSLFDHPCIYVLKKDNDPYPVQALPTCNHALSVCQLEHKCIKLFEDFKLHCKVRDGVCKMESREMCMEAWKSLRSTPMLGCICPNNPMKRRCDRIFNIIHNNPCVAEEPVSNVTGNDAVVQQQKRWVELAGKILLRVSTWQKLMHPPKTGRYSAMGRKQRHLPRTGTTHTSVRPRPQAHSSNALALGTHSHPQHYNQISTQIRRGSDDEMEKRGFSEDHPAMSRKPLGLTSTCHFVLNGCQKDRDCRSALLPVLRHCDKSNCHQVSCREALHNLYANISIEWRLEIAYCLCRRSDNPEDECLVAQEKLHPVCAQRVEGPTPACHTNALACNEDRDCRSRLENFEQSCAVDSLTKKCAGSTHDCRLGLVGILGTELRDICDCKGTDFAQLYECLGWQRLLWFNPCVVQSQLDYYNKRSEILPAEMLRYGNVVPDVNYHFKKNFSKVIHANDLGFTQNFVPAIVNTKEMNSNLKENTRPPIMVTANTPKKTTIKTTPTTTTTTTSTTVRTTTTTSTTTTTTTMTTPTTTSTTTTTTTTTTTPAPTTTTLPPKFCLVERQHQPAQFILEGNARRLYKDDEPECSEVCHCQIGEHLECRTICVKRAACKSEFAFYNHAAPAYQAYRGRCICYSGRFICVRPPPGHYSLPQGIFMFLGYSEVDETLLKPHNNLSVIDIASMLQHLLSQMYNRTTCTLEMYNITGENLIMAAHIIRPVNVTLRYSEIAALGKECSDQLQDLSDKINSRDLEVHSHLLLSILKLAEVEVKLPEVVEDSSVLLSPGIPLILVTFSYTLSFLTFS